MTRIRKQTGLILLAAASLISAAAAVHALQEPQDRVPVVEMPHKTTVRLLAFGDSGTGSAGQKAVAAAMEARCLEASYDGILLLGDVVYPRGVSSVSDPRWRTHLFEPYGGPCLGKVPLFPVLGNHDREGNIEAWSEMAAVKPRWVFPAENYHVVFPGLLDVYALDSTHPGGIKTILPEESDQGVNPWTIAFGHHPIISDADGPGRHQGGGLSGWWMKYLLCDTTDAYIAGHAHLMEHVVLPGCRMDQFVSGAAGGALASARGDVDDAFMDPEPGFLELEFTPTKMVSRFITTKPGIAYEITKPVRSKAVRRLGM